jgi:RND family efflux transporter MFP subunit
MLWFSKMRELSISEFRQRRIIAMRRTAGDRRLNCQRPDGISKAMTALRRSILGTVGLTALLLFVGRTPLFAAELLAKQQLDCLIEPRVTIKLGAEVAGLISNVTVDRGDRIKTGQVLAKLKSGVEEANFALAKTKAENDLQVKTNKARGEFLSRKASRQAQLKAKQAVAESTFDEASTDAAMGKFATKEAELNWQVAQLEVMHQEELLKQRTILSPIDGVVVERTLSAGEYTNETKHILTIAQIDPLNVEVFVPISYYGQTVVGSQAEVFPESPFGGHYLATVAVVDHVMDAASGTFGVRLRLANPDYLIPAGINCKIHFTETATSGHPVTKEDPARATDDQKADGNAGTAGERAKRDKSDKAAAAVERTTSEKLAIDKAASEKEAAEEPQVGREPQQSANRASSAEANSRAQQ